MSTACVWDCICRRKIQLIINRIEASDSEPTCITVHEGFHIVCLRVWVLAIFKHRLQYGAGEVSLTPSHEKVHHD